MTIQEALQNIKNAVLGRDMRQSIYDGIDTINKESKADMAAKQKTIDTYTGKMDLLDDKYEEQIKNMTLESPSDAEIVDARRNEDGKVYDTLKKRLDSITNEEKYYTMFYEVSGTVFLDAVSKRGSAKLSDNLLSDIVNGEYDMKVIVSDSEYNKEALIITSDSAEVTFNFTDENFEKHGNVNYIITFEYNSSSLAKCIEGLYQIFVAKQTSNGYFREYPDKRVEAWGSIKINTTIDSYSSASGGQYYCIVTIPFPVEIERIESIYVIPTTDNYFLSVSVKSLSKENVQVSVLSPVVVRDEEITFYYNVVGTKK